MRTSTRGLRCLENTCPGWNALVFVCPLLCMVQYRSCGCSLPITPCSQSDVPGVQHVEPTSYPRHVPKFDALNYLKELHFVPASHIILPEFLQLSDLQGFADHFVVIEAMLSCAQHIDVLRAHAAAAAATQATPLASASSPFPGEQPEPFDTLGYRNAFVVSPVAVGCAKCFALREDVCTCLLQVAAGVATPLFH